MGVLYQKANFRQDTYQVCLGWKVHPHRESWNHHRMGNNMIELLKCFATGLVLIAVALTVVGLTIMSCELVSILPFVGGIIYVTSVVLLIAVGAGWVVRASMMKIGTIIGRTIDD